MHDRIFLWVTSFIYLFAAVALTGISLMIMGWSVYEIFVHIDYLSSQDYVKKPGEYGDHFITIMLQSVRAIIIAVAVLDVSKYMVEEEVFRVKDLRFAREARETITKIMVIISIAVSIEGVIYIFKAGGKDMSLLVYPAILIATSALLILVLGIYQRLSMEVETSCEARNNDENDKN